MTTEQITEIRAKLQSIKAAATRDVTRHLVQDSDPACCEQRVTMASALLALVDGVCIACGEITDADDAMLTIIAEALGVEHE